MRQLIEFNKATAVILPNANTTQFLRPYDFENLWLNVPDIVGPGWTDNGAGVFTTTGAIGALSQKISDLIPGRTYRARFTMIGTYALTGLDVHLGAIAPAASFASNDSVIADLVAGADNTDLTFSVPAIGNFIGTIQAISLQLRTI